MKTTLCNPWQGGLLLITCLVCSFFSWGQSITVSYDFSDSGSESGLNADPPIAVDSNIGFASFKNSGTSNPGIYSNQLRLYQNATKGGSIKVYAQNGVTITEVVVYASDRTGPAEYTVDNGSATAITISGGAYTMTSLNGTSEIEFYQKDGSSGNRIYVDSFEVTYSTGGNLPPSIANIVQTPTADNVTSSDAVSVSADLTDSDGIAAAELHWGTTSGSLANTIAMSLSSGDTYTTNSAIPAQADGTSVYYEIEVTDSNEDAEITTSDEQTYTVDDSVSILSEDFSDCGSTNWTAVSVSSNKNWSCGSGYQGINAYGGNEASEDYLISPEINLNLYQNETFSFESYTNFADTYYPPIELLYTTNYTGDPFTTTWTSLNATFSPEDSGSWTSSGDIDISSINGAEVYFAFKYTSSGTGAGTTSDWRIDNIAINGVTGSANIPPSISNIVQTPTADNVTSSDAVSVSADLNDSDGIAAAELHWGTTSGNLTNTITMSIDSGDTYTTDSAIPAQADGTSVYYEIEVTDSNEDAEITTSDEQNYTVDDPVMTSNIAIQNFDDYAPTWGYSSDVGYFDNGFGNGFYGIINLSDTSGTYSNTNFAENILAENDLDNGSDGTSGFATTTFDAIDISTYNNVQLSFDYEIIGYNVNNDDAKYEVFYDGVSQGEEFLVDGGVDPEDASGSINISIPNTVNEVYLTIAVRNNGGSGYSAFDNFILKELSNVPPSITNIVQTPTADNVTSSDVVSVSADITDSDGIASAELHWGTTNGSLSNTIAMSLSSGDTYTTNSAIPAQADGTSVYYEIKAVDSNASAETTTSDEQSYTVMDPVAAPDLIITEVADPADDANARFVEVYNNGANEIDFSVTTVYLARYANANTDPQTVQLTGTLAAGDYYVVGGSESSFNTAYGFDADLISGIISGNGDDTYALYVGGDADAGTLFDIYGEIGTDGSGEAWEYEDARAIRNNLSIEPNDTWTASEWTIESANTSDMTPGEGEPTADYTFVDGAWSPMTPVGNATPSDDIAVQNGTVTISSAIEMNNLTVSSGATLNIENVLTVNGDITNNGNITFISNASGTAQFDTFDGSISGSGNITVQRYVPANRAFRFMSSAVNTTTSIHANWQEGVNNTSTETNLNPNPGYGIHITGSTDGSNGFDATVSGNPSMFGFDNAAQAWTDVANTNATNLTAGKAYRLYVRGNRGITVTDNEATPTNTIIRATGTLATGDVANTNMGDGAGEFNFIGNPYQAVVDMSAVLTNSTNLNTNYYYCWDPSLDSGNGAYVTIDLSVGDGDPSPAASAANKYLQPGQAAFVSTLNNGSASILFKESNKTTGQTAGNDLFRTTDENAYIKLSLFAANAHSNGDTPSDGIKVKFSNGASNEVLANDAPKLGNLNENIAFVNNGNYLSIEQRAFPQDGEQLTMFINNYRNSNYVFEAKVENIAPNITAFLKDAYLGTETPLVTGETTNVSFSINQDIEASMASDRFSIVFRETLGVNAHSLTTFQVYPNPNQDGHITLKLPNYIQGQVSVSLYNALGQQVIETQKQATTSGVLHLITNLSAGVYMVKVKAQGINSVQKLIVQ